MKTSYAILIIVLSMAPALYSQQADVEIKKEQKSGEPPSVTDQEKRAADKENEGGAWARGSMPDDKYELLDAMIHGTPFRWLMLGGSYTIIPSPGWYSNQYGGFMVTSLRLSDTVRLMYRAQYSYYHTTRDENFPERLQNLGNNVVLRADWFQAG